MTERSSRADALALQRASQEAQARTYRSRGGVQIAPPRERFELLMRDRSGRDLRATGASFEALLEIREQLMRLGYGLVRLERQV